MKKQERFRANIYLQSKIVRPASKINALITVKDRRFISANKLPIKVIFREQFGKKLESKVYHTDSYGLINYSYQLDRSDRSGVYQIEAYIGESKIGSSAVRVEAFVPPKIENHLHIERDNYFMGELIEANISSNYLFGTPASWLTGR